MECWESARGRRISWSSRPPGLQPHRASGGDRADLPAAGDSRPVSAEGQGRRPAGHLRAQPQAGRPGDGHVHERSRRLLPLRPGPRLDEPAVLALDGSRLAQVGPAVPEHTRRCEHPLRIALSGGSNRPRPIRVHQLLLLDGVLSQSRADRRHRRPEPDLFEPATLDSPESRRRRLALREDPHRRMVEQSHARGSRPDGSGLVVWLGIRCFLFADGQVASSRPRPSVPPATACPTRT